MCTSEHGLVEGVDVPDVEGSGISCKLAVCMYFTGSPVDSSTDSQTPKRHPEDDGEHVNGGRFEVKVFSCAT